MRLNYVKKAGLSQQEKAGLTGDKEKRPSRKGELRKESGLAWCFAEPGTRVGGAPDLIDLPKLRSAVGAFNSCPPQ